MSRNSWKQNAYEFFSSLGAFILVGRIVRRGLSSSLEPGWAIAISLFTAVIAGIYMRKLIRTIDESATPRNAAAAPLESEAPLTRNST